MIDWCRLEWVVVIAAEALVGIVDSLYADRYMHAHTRFYWRELRVPACSPGPRFLSQFMNELLINRQVLAYNQFLESYRSVSLAGIAASF